MKQEQVLEYEEEIRDTMVKSPAEKLSLQKPTAISKAIKSNQLQPGKDGAGELAKGIGKAIETLIASQETFEEGPQELLQEHRQRKKQSRKIRR